MSTPTSGKAWIYAVSAVFFLAVGVRDLGVWNDVDVPAAVWELTFAVANGLFVWYHRGAPSWVRPAATGLFLVGVGLALVDIAADFL